jgi:hypothetical protein
LCYSCLYTNKHKQKETNPYRGADSKWHRGKNNIDDLYMSFLFCEVAIYLLLNHSVSNDFEVGSFSYR